MKDRVLIVEDNTEFANCLKNSLGNDPLDVEIVSNGSLAIQKMRDPANYYAVCVLDYNLPDMTGVDVARRICKQNPNQEIIFMTADDRVEAFKDMVGLGYTKRFAIKGAEASVLAKNIRDAVESYNKLSRKFSGPQASSSQIEQDLKSIGMVGRSQKLHDVFKLVQKLKSVKGSVLILGGTGTGKELVSSALNNTPNSYFPLNCAAYGTNGENFIATQLFGHVKGAYTGADKDQTGVLERAHRGTVFLDEIHCMSTNAQRTLLRAIETRRVAKFGDTSGHGVQVDFRLICAGKPEIEKMIETDLFVKDLYYRIAEYVIHIPDLTDRREDIEPLILHFIQQINNESPKTISIRGEAIRTLEDYTWPGNARDLRNAIKQLAIDTPDGEITRIDAERFLARRMKIEDVKASFPLSEAMENTEKEAIKNILRQSTSIRKAALRLQMPKSTLCHKIKKFNIDPERYLLTEADT